MARASSGESSRRATAGASSAPGDFDGGPGRAKILRDGLEVLHVRAHDDRLAEQRRLEDVVAAAYRQRAAHEDHVGQREQAAQFADGIEQQHAGRARAPARRRGGSAAR